MATATEKHLLIVASGGRTGTRFLGEILQDVIEDCASFHEPDVITTDLRSNIRKIRQFGIYRNFFGKLIDRTGLRAISLRHLAGQLDTQSTADEIRRHRSRFYANQEESLIVDSSLQWFGLLDAVPEAIPNHRVVCVIRDPRAWVTSAEQWGHWWASSFDWVTRLGLLRLNPCLLSEPKNCQRWPKMSTFEKLCWSWTALNRAMIDAAAHHPGIEVFRFEDLFLAANRRLHMQQMMEFATNFSDRSFKYNIDELINRKAINISGGSSNDKWKIWSKHRCQILDRHCGTLMRKLQYGNEHEWHEKL